MRKSLTALAVAALVAGFAGSAAADDQWMHATSLIDTPKYPADFKHFDYVNVNAPKGGTVRLSSTGTFDSLNFVPPRGTLADGIGLIYDTLMTPAMDEVSTEYGLLAEALKYPDDYSSVTYKLRTNAKWQDGEPVTPDDVVYSFDVLKQFNPGQAFYYRHVEKAEKTGDNEVTFTFDVKGNRELPHIVGQLLILPKHFWEGTDAKGNKRDISKSGLDVPLGSGPYKVKSVVPGRTITYERDPDYWGKDLPVNVGSNNFDQIRYDFFRDETVEFEAFKGDQVDWRQETTARVWAQEYDFPAVKQARVIKEMFEQPYRSSGLMVGFIFNLNRDTFKDARVRQAFNLAFPFEDINKDIFYGQYVRLKSYFDGTPLAASGLPEGRELEYLNEVKDKVPPEVFTTEFTNPVNTGTSARNNLRQALALLKDAGWQLKGNKLVNAATGQPMVVEFLMNGPIYEKVALRYQTELAKLGITLNIRPVDTAQYENRVRGRDFDLVYSGWAQSMSPGNEQIEFFGSESADREGSRNYGGIRNPAVDALIQKVILAPNRDDLIAATKALDRVLLWNSYVVPGWTLRAARVARWDRFSHPDPLPEYSIGFPTIWWWDADKAAKTGAPK
ncbi:MAG: ABC transporter substrate-binding protein [Rhizobiales bacterium]|nr:ABC transporter substrate-binding protein [Hyphomicrobiales bacterium]MBN9009167.1 ABC transporter substrate-binding protein [Hyphomicrobiales bacterium]